MKIIIKLIKISLLVLIVLWIYGTFKYKSVVSSVVDDPCKTTSSINNCYTISDR